jgi:hypothetical protein
MGDLKKLRGVSLTRRSISGFGVFAILSPNDMFSRTFIRG